MKRRLRRTMFVMNFSCLVMAACVAVGQESFKMEHLARYRDGVGKVVEDPQSKTGRAKLGLKSETERSIMMFFYYSRPYPGKYRLSFRMKYRNAEDEEKPVCSLRVISRRQRVLTRAFGPKDLGPEGHYTVVSAEFPYKREDVSPRVEIRYEGGADLWLDWALVERLSVFSDEELFKERKVSVPRIEPKKKDKVSHVHVVEGPFYELYCGKWLKEAVPGLRLTETMVRNSRAQDFPREPGFWGTIDVAVLANVSARVLDVYERKLLEEYVKAGGSLLITGGLNSLGKGMYYKTFLENVLPVKTSGPWDVVKAAGPLRLNPTDQFAQVSKGIDWRDPPWALYYHKVGVPEGAMVLIRAGEQPFLVSGSYGKGKVVVICAPALGKEAPKGGQLFFRWDQWRKLIGNLIKWMDKG